MTPPSLRHLLTSLLAVASLPPAPGGSAADQRAEQAREVQLRNLHGQQAAALDPRDQRAGLVVTNDTTSWCPTPNEWNKRYNNWGCPYYNCQDLTKTLNDTVWLATFSHAIAEGGAGERAYTARFTDEGQSWTKMLPLEESLELASHGSGLIKGSTAVPLTSSANRVYVVYQYNSENTTTTPDGRPLHGRTDMLGKGFFFRWTDDGGLTWSKRLFREFRSTEIDLHNPWKGVDVKLMHIDAEPEVIGNRVFIPFTKCQTPAGETTPAEPWIYSSPDLLTVADPNDATWELLPEGDIGVAPPDNSTQLLEENHLVMVGSNPDRLLMLGRGDTGKLWATYSGDGGRHFDSPASWLTYTPGGDDCIKNPRGSAAPFRVPSSGNYILLYYNNPADQLGSSRYTLWISGGRAIPSTVNGVDSSMIAWSQPEILMFDPTWIPLTPTSSRDPMVAWPAGSQASGYCGFYEDSEGVAFIGSQKSGYELFHRISKGLLTTIWTQHEAAAVAAGPIADLAVTGTATQHKQLATVIPGLAENGGISVSAWINPPGGGGGWTPLVELACDSGGIRLEVQANGSLSAHVNLGVASVFTSIVPTGKCVNELGNAGPKHIGVIVDGGAHVLSLVVNGVLCDGADSKGGAKKGATGWVYLPAKVASLGGCELTAAAGASGLKHVRVHPRALLTTEMIGAWRAGLPVV